MRKLREKFMSQLVNLIINNVPFYVRKTSHPLQLQINLEISFYCRFLYVFSTSRFEYKSQSRLLFYHAFSLVKNLEEDLRTTKHKSVIWEGKIHKEGECHASLQTAPATVSITITINHPHTAICSGKHPEMLREWSDLANFVPTSWQRKFFTTLLDDDFGIC